MDITVTGDRPGAIVGEVKFVMLANAGTQVRFRFKFQNRLDSAGMTGTRVDKFRTLGLKPRRVQFRESPAVKLTQGEQNGEAT